MIQLPSVLVFGLGVLSLFPPQENVYPAQAGCTPPDPDPDPSPRPAPNPGSLSHRYPHREYGLCVGGGGKETKDKGGRERDQRQGGGGGKPQSPGFVP